MPGFLRTGSKKSVLIVEEDEEEERQSLDSRQSTNTIQRMAKGVKKQMRRLDSAYHHVTHTEHRERTKSTPNLAVSPHHLFRSISLSRRRSSAKLNSELDLSESPTSSPSSSFRRKRPSVLAEDAIRHRTTSLPTPISPPSIETIMQSPLEPLDPFLVDEEGDEASEIPLGLEEQAPVVVPDVNKEIPPAPVVTVSQSDEEEEEEEVPELFVPALVAPSLFLPIPNTDPLTTLLNKYIYPPERRPHRDVSGDWQRTDFHTLVMTNSWRSLAKMARDRLLVADPRDIPLVLGLWHLRLSCLARLRLFNQTSAECTNLFSVLNAVEPPDAKAYLFDRLLPFELEVMQTRLKYWAGDHMGYLDTLSVLLARCRAKARNAGSDEVAVPMWKERGSRVALILASQLVEMKEYTAAAQLLEPLCVQEGVESPPLRSSVGRIYLQGGNVDMAQYHMGIVADDPNADETLKTMNAAILAAADGDWEDASHHLREILDKDDLNFVAVNNLAVVLLGQGKLKEGIEILEKALAASPSSTVVAEPFLFNLSTLYELRNNLGFERKKDLLVEVAKWSGDGLRTNALKMPVN